MRNIARALVLSCLLASGCFQPAGGGGGGFRDPIAGTDWWAPIDGVLCVMVFSFGDGSDSGKYGYVFTCELGDGSQAASVEYGTYTIDQDTIYMTAREASCPRSQVTIYAEFPYNLSASGNTLTLIGPSGAANFAIVAPSDPSPGTIAVGCFDAAGYFTTRPISQL